MKNYLIFIALACLCACSNDFDAVSEQDGKQSLGPVDFHKIDGAKALDIANLYFGKAQTRSAAPLKMEYIIEPTMTRSSTSGEDTLAYILNRGTNDGFVVVSSDDRVYPILAHSETGNFRYETGDIIDKQFISRLGAYIDANKDEEAKTVSASHLLGCASTFPALSTSWDQGDPWDKYVIREHPGCLVGCVAVATGMIMSHCKFSYYYHGINFEFARIVEGLRTNFTLGNREGHIPMTRIVNGEPTKPKVDPFSREVAFDYAAQLLYWIGKDVGMSYSPDGSGANPYMAQNLLKKEGYKVNTDYILYDVQNAIKYLLDKNLLFMGGWATLGEKVEGHAWVADGCRYCVDPATKDTVIAEIHCDWGWSGYANGYYSGSIFQVDNYRFKQLHTFAVGIE